MFTADRFLILHRYLHDSALTSVTYNGQNVPFFTNKTGMRYCIIDGVKYIQQNPQKPTSYGQMARNGHKITWGIKDGKWNLAIDDQVKHFGTPEA